MRWRPPFVVHRYGDAWKHGEATLRALRVSTPFNVHRLGVSTSFSVCSSSMEGQWSMFSIFSFFSIFFSGHPCMPSPSFLEGRVPACSFLGSGVATRPYHTVCPTPIPVVCLSSVIRAAHTDLVRPLSFRSATLLACFFFRFSTHSTTCCSD